VPLPAGSTLRQTAGDLIAAQSRQRSADVGQVAWFNAANDPALNQPKAVAAMSIKLSAAATINIRSTISMGVP